MRAEADVTGAGEKKQLGRILLQQRLVSASMLDGLLEAQRASPDTRLASLTAASGHVAEVDLLRALSEQHGVPGIDVTQVVVPLENLALIPLEIAKQHGILPFLARDEQIFLAMSDPSDRRVIDEIEFVTGRRISPYVALHDALQELIDVCYRAAERGETHHIGAAVPRDYLEQVGLADREPAPSPLEGATAGRTEAPDRGEVSGVSPTPRAPSAGGSSMGGASTGDSAKGGPSLGGLAPAADDLAEFSFADVMDDDAEPAPPLDPVFESRVAPLPTRPSASVRADVRVLMIDADEGVRRVVARALGERGYAASEAASGADGIAALRAAVPDVLIIDATLPDVHALELCRRVKASQRYGQVPILVVSAVHRGWRFAEDLRESWGVQAFLEKPFAVGEVLAAIERCLDGRGADGADADAISHEAHAALAAGMEAFKAGDLPRAIAQLERGVAIDPRAFRLHYHLGLLYGKSDASVFEAIQALETAVRLAPRSFPALKNLAVLYQRAGFRHQAMDVWERALGASPDDETKRGIQDHLLSLF